MAVFQKLFNIPRSIKKRWQTCFRFLHDYKNARWYFWISLLIPVTGMLILVVILPLRNINRPLDSSQTPIANPFISVDPNADNFEELKYFSSHRLELKLKELFLNSQLVMAKSDSIGLILNLVDSTLSLCFRGVTIRECPIHRFKMSQRFKHLKANQQLFHWLSRPFLSRDDWATIPRVPIKIRKAPKDTIEAKKYKTEPAAPDRPDVYYNLKFDRYLFIKVHQVEPNSIRGIPRLAYFHLKSYSRLIADTFVTFYHLKTPRGSFWIELTISQNDAIAIYRALPTHAALALRI